MGINEYKFYNLYKNISLSGTIPGGKLAAGK
jgi:hypothetical protein